MTEQYAKTNINNPQSPRLLANTVADPNIDLTPDDSFLVIDTTLAVGLANLPLAQSMPGRSITIVAETGATNSLGFAAAAGNTLVVPASATNPIATVNGTLTATSDGGDYWYITAGAA